MIMLFQVHFYNVTFKLYSACCFIGTWNVGSTTPGAPYVAKWPDQYGNIKQRDVLRPDIIGKFFKEANVIDVRNHRRQNFWPLKDTGSRETLGSELTAQLLVSL